MIDLGKCKPGDTIRIPWASYTLSTGASSAASNYAAADILIYKDGSTTERASTAGFTATTTFDSLTGINLTTIDLADNTTAGFFAAGSEYIVIIGPVTVDSQTVYFPLARFHIGYDGAILDTTIATLASQTSFTLTAGPAEDDALNGSIVLIHDVASAVQHGYGVVLDYTGSTKTVTLAAGTTFTAAAADNVSIFVPANITHVAGTAWASVDLTATMKASVNTEVLDVLNVNTMVAGKTIADALKIIGASAAGVVSGAGTGTEVFKDFAGTTKLTVTVDSSGNRTLTVYA